ncbi:Oidioi.mRNA.OKI2018_I69.chr2.g4068.t1.cds [Oikopleura dioica]|uniref:Oidioi.mRNA.OKI2018_I69.chr2.g4068.t1.cds n=1 Tax=Oikopleura dioica TaxID=34765 RepID=A0ABN7T0E1_OIKDI|nr:Oidioi.mRNA.OKI2018_I69.chr2.g4068.t1.cds [Oikopleura dioica]
MSFNSNSGAVFDIAMSYVGPQNPISQLSYNVASLKQTTDKSAIFKYSGDDGTKTGLYQFWSNGFYWTRNGTDSINIIGKSEQYQTDLSFFDLKFQDRDFQIFVPPEFEKVLYPIDDDEGDCKEDCFPLRIGDPSLIDKELYTFTMDPE